MLLQSDAVPATELRPLESSLWGRWEEAPVQEVLPPSCFLTVTLSQQLLPSVSPAFFLSFSAVSLAHTIELGSVSGIEWLELMANYLPL